MGLIVIIPLIIFGAIVIISLWLMAIYNGLIKLKNQVDEGWSDIDVQLKRRYDLIPNLVAAVKGYMTHEKGLLEKITELRSGALKAEAPKEKAALEGQLSGMLKNLLVSVENYPDLKANQNVAKLQDELTDTENKIQAARRFYNGVVRDFNIKIQVFPNNLVAGMLGFIKREFFEVENEAERKNVKVEL